MAKRHHARYDEGSARRGGADRLNRTVAGYASTDVTINFTDYRSQRAFKVDDLIDTSGQSINTSLQGLRYYDDQCDIEECSQPVAAETFRGSYVWPFYVWLPTEAVSERKKALADCKAKVNRIAEECKSRNRKFRDIEFDLENDRDRCLHGLHAPFALAKYNPSDVQRVTEIFEKPEFFVDGADSNDIIQGRLGDCWFLSALATMSTAKGLVEEFCAAFIIRCREIHLQISMLFTNIPKFEELSSLEKELYHNDREIYNKSARKSGKGLFFARSGTQGETWVPLMEKAYAKLHGDYQAINAGYTSEAIEDLTGYASSGNGSNSFFLTHVESGVSSFIPTRDILDPDRFWREELLMAQDDRLFGCHFDILDISRSGSCEPLKASGLIGGHAYSILRAVEHKGRRFLVIRNPWGNSEWTGPWSDGSKEWNQAGSLELMSTLNHVFGDDGQFIMEWHYRRLGFVWSFDFILFKKGSEIPVAESTHPLDRGRSTNLEVELEVGEYVLHSSDSESKGSIYRRHILLDYKAKGVKIAHLPISPTIIAGRDLSEVERAVSAIEKLARDNPRAELGRILDLDKLQLVDKLQNGDAGAEQVAKTIDEKAPGTPREEDDMDTKTTVAATLSEGRDRNRDTSPDDMGSEVSDHDDPQDEDHVFLGLRVYTKQSAPSIIRGQLRRRRDFTNFTDPDLTIKL
ncbi:hypothetical protein BD779DRAFT_1475013 [Infundibulicybe gibba]|nr:hypothetical protein BD779DRAFT_1475013 [Infundibulicybe gibba]